MFQGSKNGRLLWLAFLVLIGLAFVFPKKYPKEHLQASAPYLQIGEHPAAGRLDLCWQTNDSLGWEVEFKGLGSTSWSKAAPPKFHRITLAGKETRFLMNTTMDGLPPGAGFTYRLNWHGDEISRFDARTPGNDKQHVRFVAMGDIGAGSREAKLIAGSAFQQRPDYVVIPGDIVYDRGLSSEYDRNFWPVYNADKLDSNGAPLMRSTTFIAAPGNHDTEGKDLGSYPDALAYFYYWMQPLNGPGKNEGPPAFNDVHIPDSLRAAFMAGTGDRYPSMANFSFDQGNVHWLFLDANPYVNWTDATMRDWVRRDLAGSKATWKFVLYHHPGFNSSRAHFEQQQMRTLSPIFDSSGVDVVFTGHVHNYQRSYPMSFIPEDEGMTLTDGPGSTRPRGRVINGLWTLDKTFDGVKNTRPKGVIYLVTGSGGQDLYDPEQENAPDTWQKFTKVFHSTTHSISVVDIDGRSLSMKQVDLGGKTVDAFRITK